MLDTEFVLADTGSEPIYTQRLTNNPTVSIKKPRANSARGFSAKVVAYLSRQACASGVLLPSMNGLNLIRLAQTS